jgi:L-asparagine transporter-like permease
VVSASGYSLVQSRLLVMAALDRRLPQRLARVAQHGVPRAALIFQFWTTLVVSVLLSGLAAGISSNADFATILFNLVPASAAVLWSISSLTLFLAGLILLGRYSRYARTVGGPGNGLVGWCCLLGLLATMSAIVVIFLVPWTPLLSPGAWFFWVGFLVLFSLAVGGVYSFVFAAEPADVQLLWVRAKQRALSASAKQTPPSRQDTR